MRAALSTAMAASCLFFTATQIHAQKCPQHQFETAIWNDEGDNTIQVVTDRSFYLENGVDFRIDNLAGDISPVAIAPITTADFVRQANQPSVSSKPAYN